MRFDKLNSKYNINLLVQLLVSAAAYFVLLYYTPRSDFVQFFALYTILFLSFFLIYHKISLRQALVVAIAFRIIAYLSIPVLSDDFYRFLWDGLLAHNELNPYLYTPQFAFEQGHISSPYAELLLQEMNSSHYYTVYPPLNQMLFEWSTSIFGQADSRFSMVGIKLWILLAEIGTILLLPKVLQRFQIKPKNAVLYSLNPLIIIELCGNAHFEAVMIFILLLAFLFFEKKQISWAAIFFGCAVSIKLIPLLFLPIALRYLSWKKFLQFTAIVILVNGLLWIPYMSAEFVSNFSSSIGLYFQSFQFNSFFYFILFDVLSDPYRHWVSSLLLILPLSVVIWYSFTSSSMMKNWPAKANISQSIYYFCAAVVHPWYISTIVFLNCFHPMKFALVWSYIIGLSYFTYRTDPYEESELIIAIQYVLIFTVLFVDWIQVKRQKFKAQR